MAVGADFVINRNYLDTKFEGYKLNTDSLPICTKSILNGIIGFICQEILNNDIFILYNGMIILCVKIRH